MKAAIVQGAGQAPVYGDFKEPVAGEGESLVTVTACALSHLTKRRAMGTHYSSTGDYPLIPGVDGVGKFPDGRRVFFAAPRPPFGSMAERTVVSQSMCAFLPEGLGDVEAAGMANPGMSCWLAFKERAHFQAGESVLINGATGTAGRMAVQVARHLGAKRIVATGRNLETLKTLSALGVETAISLGLPDAELEKAFMEQFDLGVDVVLDYLWGPSAGKILVAAAKANPDGHRVRYVEIGAVGGDVIPFPAEVLRATALELMGSGLGSVPMERVVKGIGEMLAAAVPGKFKVDMRIMPLAKIGEVWASDTGNPRLVFTAGD